MNSRGSFGSITMCVIFLNAIWISIDIEFNDAAIISEAEAGFVVVENLFCTSGHWKRTRKRVGKASKNLVSPAKVIENRWKLTENHGKSRFSL